MPLDTVLLTKQGNKTFGELSASCKLMGFYFSMHDCAPCQEFTPIFAELYKEVNEENPGCLECVYFSADKTQDLFEIYYAEQPWTALNRGDANIKTVAQQFNVKGVPRLIMVNSATGAVIDDNCLDKVKNTGPIAIEEFLSKI